jgi:hypothetical protein
MSEHEKDLAFLRQCIRYDDAAERCKLEERIAQVQRDDRCVRRAVSLTALLIALGAAGLAYGAVLQDNFPYGKSQLVIKLLCELELAALISLAVFAGLLMAYRKELNRLREQCRRLAAKLLESRLGKPRAAPLTGAVKEQELIVNRQPAVN